MEKNIKERNKDFIRIFYAGGVLSKAQNLVNPKDVDFLLEEALLQRNYSDTITATHFFNIGERGTKEIRNLQCPVLIYHGE